MKSRLIAALILTFGTAALAADEANPYAKAKVGDYATYKMVTKVAGIPVEGTLTQTVIAVVDGKEVTIGVSGTVGNQDLQGKLPDSKIDLTKPFDPTKPAGPLTPGTSLEVVKEKDKDGKEVEAKERIEKLKVGSNEYSAKVETFMLKVKAGGMDFPARLRIWQVKDIPVPMAKMEFIADVAEQRLEIQMELLETGNRPPEKKDPKDSPKDVPDPKKQ